MKSKTIAILWAELCNTATNGSAGAVIGDGSTSTEMRLTLASVTLVSCSHAPANSTGNFASPRSTSSTTFSSPRVSRSPSRALRANRPMPRAPKAAVCRLRASKSTALPVAGCGVGGVPASLRRRRRAASRRPSSSSWLSVRRAKSSSVSKRPAPSQSRISGTCWAVSGPRSRPAVGRAGSCSGLIQVLASTCALPRKAGSTRCPRLVCTCLRWRLRMMARSIGPGRCWRITCARPSTALPAPATLRDARHERELVAVFSAVRSS